MYVVLRQCPQQMVSQKEEIQMNLQGQGHQATLYVYIYFNV